MKEIFKSKKFILGTIGATATLIGTVLEIVVAMMPDKVEQEVQNVNVTEIYPQ